MIRWVALALVLGARVVSAQPETASERAGVQVSTRVSQTAVWVGDPIELVVEFLCAPQVDVIADDLTQDKLGLEGLDVVSTSVEREAAPDGGVVQRFRYALRSYETASPTLHIGAWPVRYYVRRMGERPEDARPAGEVQVPGVVIARRSTLPDEVKTIDLRATQGPGDQPTWLDAARLVGLGLILLAAAPLALWAMAMIARWQTRTQRPRAAMVRAQARSALEELRVADATTETGRREAYGLLDRAVRQHIADTRGVPAHALASGELAARLHALGSPLANATGELLAECERARYGPPDRLPPQESFGTALDTAERILQGAR